MPVPLTRHPDRPGGPHHQTPSGEQKPRSVFGRVFRRVGWLAGGPADWAGVKGIRRSASFIGDLSQAVRTCSQLDPRLHVREHGEIDLLATAFSCGVPVPELERHLAARRQQTARIAYGTFALACVFLLAWVRAALLSPWTASRIMLAIDFLPFVMLFFLIAFHNALLNFQIRTGRAASWREYLMTSEAFLPR